MAQAERKPEVLERWVAAHDAALRAYVGRRVEGRAQADDVVQDTYMRLLRAGPGLEKVRNPRGFLLRVASNLIADAFRRRGSRGKEAALDEAVMDVLDDAGLGSPERRLIGREALAGLEAGIAALTPKARACVHLVRFQGLSPREAARVLGMTEKAVTRQLERALSTLAARLSDDDA